PELPPPAEFRYQAPDLRVQFTEDSAAIRLMPNARVSDVELDGRNGGAGDWSGASIIIGPKSGDGGHGSHGWHWGWWGGNSDDQLGVEDGKGLSFCDGQILK